MKILGSHYYNPETSKLVDLHDLKRFIDERCTKSKTTLPFSAFVTAFNRWLPTSIARDDVFFLMQGQDRLDMHVAGKAAYVFCVILEEQSEMVGS